MRHSPVLTVDCGTSRVLVGRFTSDGAGRLALQRFGAENLPRRDRTEETWLAETAAALAGIARRESLHGACVVGLPGHLVFTRVLELPPLPARQRRRIIRFDARQGIPAPLEGVAWTHVPLGRPAGGAAEVLTAVHWSAIEALAARLGAAGLFPTAMLPAWRVLRRGVAFDHPDAGRSLAIAVGARSTQLVHGDAVRPCIRMLALGGDTITEKIAADLGLNFSQAEELKRRVLGAAPAAEPTPEVVAVRTAVDEFVRRLAGELGRSLARASPGSAEAGPAIVCLSGGGARIEGLSARLTESLHLPVVRPDPWPRLKADGAGMGSRETIDADHLSVLVDLAVAAVDRTLPPVNLLPRSLRREMWVRRRWPWLAAGAALLALALGGAIGREQTRAGESQRGAAAVDSAIAGLRRVERQIRDNLDRLAETNRRIASMQRLIEAKRAWTGFFADLQDRLANAEDAWLERLQVIPPAEYQAAAGARTARANPADPAAAPPPLRISLAGCLLDPENPLGHVGDDSSRRARALLAQLRASPFVARLEDEHFDSGQPGILRFEVTLVLAPGKLR